MVFNLIVSALPLTCSDAIISIDETVFKTDSTGFSLTVPVWSAQQTISWTDSIVSVLVGSTSTACGSLVYAFKNPDGSPFTATTSILYDLTAKTFSMVATDPALVNSYSLKLSVSLADYPAAAACLRPFKV